MLRKYVRVAVANLNMLELQLIEVTCFRQFIYDLLVSWGVLFLVKAASSVLLSIATGPRPRVCLILTVHGDIRWQFFRHVVKYVLTYRFFYLRH